LIPTIIDIIAVSERKPNINPPLYNADADVRNVKGKHYDKIIKPKLLRMWYEQKIDSALNTKTKEEIVDMLTRMQKFSTIKSEKELISSLLRESKEGELTVKDIMDSLPEMSQGLNWIYVDIVDKEYGTYETSKTKTEIDRLDRRVDEELKKFSEKGLKALAELANKSAPELCRELEKWFMSNKLFVKTSIVKSKK
jgi:hypothetical protein